MFQRVGARLAVSLQGLPEVVQADLAGGDVLQGDRHVLRIADLDELLVGPAIKLQGFLEAVLAEHHVADVGVEPRQAQTVSVSREDAAGPLGAHHGLVVEPEIDQGLKGAAEGASDLQFLSVALVDGDRLAVILPGGF